jgi:hypothetical protein
MNLSEYINTKEWRKKEIRNFFEEVKKVYEVLKRERNTCASRYL